MTWFIALIRPKCCLLRIETRVLVSGWREGIFCGFSSFSECLGSYWNLTSKKLSHVEVAWNPPQKSGFFLKLSVMKFTKTTEVLVFMKTISKTSPRTVVHAGKRNNWWSNNDHSKDGLSVALLKGKFKYSKAGEESESMNCSW